MTALMKFSKKFKNIRTIILGYWVHLNSRSYIMVGNSSQTNLINSLQVLLGKMTSLRWTPSSMFNFKKIDSTTWGDESRDTSQLDSTKPKCSNSEGSHWSENFLTPYFIIDFSGLYNHCL